MSKHGHARDELLDVHNLPSYLPERVIAEMLEHERQRVAIHALRHRQRPCAVPGDDHGGNTRLTLRGYLCEQHLSDQPVPDPEMTMYAMQARAALVVLDNEAREARYGPKTVHIDACMRKPHHTGPCGPSYLDTKRKRSSQW